MKQPTKEQATKYFHRMGMKDREGIYKFLRELGDLDLVVRFITPYEYQSDFIVPQIGTLNPTQHIELAQLLRKVARIIELSDVAFPR